MIMSEHPSHKKQVASLRRIEGQIRGIISMIDNEKYCVSILNQIKAAKSALVRVEAQILKKHTQSCVKSSLTNKRALDKKIDELLKIINK
tara:strand:+ start:323 stop:592 length:270 start_codon:yes stop_codon:yes gene_type:complete